ncbi:hypothetical protein Leucomu_13085 [Leucobacter muris]|uniref:Uncharacterized protein n=1 Tax=Leucobacter muris TaxID=1935379 RepID=A0ABX5QIF7_9MICO|nr:hypothetical protein [Leucobacter muris]QAB18720.1 hypothetical protein Leucomu_13085 [Leucobacter muris]
MASTLGTIPIKLHASIFNGTPFEIGTIEIPITGELVASYTKAGRIVIAEALERAAAELRDELKSITHDPHACPEGRSAAQCVLDCPHA